MKMNLSAIIFCLVSFLIWNLPPASAAISLLPDGVAGKYLSARVALARGQSGDAARFIERVWRQDDQNVDILRQLLLLKITTGDMPAAFGLGQKLMALRPHDHLAVLLLGIAAVKAEDYSAAKSYFEDFAKSQPRNWTRRLSVSMLNVWVAVARGETKDALATLARLRQLHPRLRSLMDLQQAVTYDLLSKPDLARSSYEQAVESYSRLFGRLGRIGEAYGRFLERHGNPARARKIYQGFVRLDGINKVIGEKGLARLAQGNKPQPLTANIHDGVAETLYYYSSLAFFSRRFEEAVLYARLALFMRASFDVAHLRLAEIFNQGKNFRAAIKNYRQIAARSDFALFAGVRIAFAYEESGRLDFAESQLFALARRHRGAAMPLAALGEIYRARRSFVKSADVYSEAIARAAPQVDWALYFSRGIALERSGQWVLAEKDLRLALSLSDENPSVLNYLGYSWLDRGSHLDRAFEMIKLAVRKAPNRGDIVDSLGWAHYRLGRFDRAVHYLERAVQLSPSESVINDHLGDALWQVGRKVEARYQWQRVLELAPTQDINLDDVRRKLEEGLAAPSAAKLRL